MNFFLPIGEHLSITYYHRGQLLYFFVGKTIENSLEWVLFRGTWSGGPYISAETNYIFETTRNTC